MLDDENPTTDAAPQGAAATEPDEAPSAAKKAAARKTTAKKSTKKTTARKSAAKKTAGQPEPAAQAEGVEPPTTPGSPAEEPAAQDQLPVAEAAPEATSDTASKPVKKAAAKKTAKKATAKKTTAQKTAQKTTQKTAQNTAQEGGAEEGAGGEAAAPAPEAPAEAESQAAEPESGPAAAAAPVPLFQPPAPAARKRSSQREEPTEPPEDREAAAGEHPDEEGADQGTRRRRRRGGRRRRKGGESEAAQAEQPDERKADQAATKKAATKKGEKEKAEKGPSPEDQPEAGGTSRRRRRRRRAGEEGEPSGEEPQNTVTRVRKGRTAEDEITALTGSTRLEAKRQRRREGREAGRRRAPIVSEAEFLARRESVDRVMVIRQKQDLTQIAVLEDKVLVEHYVARESQTSLIGNVYVGRVQNVLPSMEAAFIDIGKGRNAVLYAGEVNWAGLGSKDGNRKIEQVLKSGQSVLVQVTKDPIGHKGARLTSQIALPGRFLVYVPDGTTSGISRKLPDTERNRLKTLLKKIVPDSAGVIVRTAAEGASEEELTRDVERLTARWEDISAKAGKGNGPQLLYGEPDLTLKVVRDLFTEDFRKLVVSGDDAWDLVDGYVEHVAPDLADRLEKWQDPEKDVFAEYRVDEQIAKGLDRKVWLPSGGSLIIDRTEAMTVIDVNTGKFTGSGGNLEETVTKNNLEAAEEIVRQLRLRDIGGIIVIDFIDMVLESNRDLVLRRLVECLGRDRTRHQVAEVTSLGLVQMTRKRIGTGLVEAFSESCEHCQGRGVVVHHEPVEPKKKAEEEPRRGRRSGRGRGQDRNGAPSPPTPKDVAAMARPEPSPAEEASDGVAAPAPDAEPAKVPDAEPAKVPDAEPAKVPDAADAGDGRAEESHPGTAGAPKVVTSVRRRRSTRPAGPPSASPADGSEGSAHDPAVLPEHDPIS